MRQSSLLVSKALTHVASIIEPGVTGEYINKEAEQVIRDNGGIPAFLNHGGFPGTLCISVNEGVVHGVPTKREFQDADIVSVDCGVLMNDFYGDSAFTFVFAGVDEKVVQLCIDTRVSLYLGIAQVKPGNRIGDISYAVQNFAEREKGYSVVRELVGHGIGRGLHEAPEVPNYGKRGRGLVMKERLVIAIEPMVNLGKKKVMQAKDGFTIITKDRSPSAHYEHTVCVGADGADILSDHSGIEEVIKNREILLDIPVNS